MRMELRKARADDADDVAAILQDTFESVWRPQISPEVAQRVIDEGKIASYVSEVLPTLWVATVDGQVAGMIEWEGDFIGALHVLRRFQGLGLGTALLRLAEHEVRAAGHDRIRLETDTFNTASRRFYAKHGYEEIEFYPDVEWDSDLTTVLLAKPLP